MAQQTRMTKQDSIDALRVQRRAMIKNTFLTMVDGLRLTHDDRVFLAALLLRDATSPPIRVNPGQRRRERTMTPAQKARFNELVLSFDDSRIEFMARRDVPDVPEVEDPDERVEVV
jgi:hypothetical protein